MSDLSEGFRRLSLLAGVSCLVAWLLFAVLETGGFRNMDAGAWIAVTAGAALAFVAPWALVRGIGWTVQGFRARR